jgi:hypothetical protein
VHVVGAAMAYRVLDSRELRYGNLEIERTIALNDLSGGGVTISDEQSKLIACVARKHTTGFFVLFGYENPSWSSGPCH